MFKSEKGFTLIEMLVALAIIGILGAIALPGYKEWMRSATYGEVAREIAGAMRQARAESVTTNLECRVEFDLDGDRFRVVRGNRANNSTTWPEVVTPWQEASELVDLKGGASVDGDENINDESCDLDTGTKYIVFQPNGSLNTESSYTDMLLACILDTDNNIQLYAGIPSEATGRVLLEK